MITEFQALRLSAWGLAILLAWLIGARTYDRATGYRRPGRALGNFAGDTLITVSALVSAMTLFAFTVPLFSGYVTWLSSMKEPFALAGVALLVAAETVLIGALAYHPGFKLRWCAGWIALAHMAVWGAAFFQGAR